MADAERIEIFALDDDWQLLGRVDAGSDWPAIVAALLRMDSAWLVIEQQRLDAPSPLPRREDISLSRSLATRLRPMEMRIADHVIRNRKSRFSFRQAGLL